LRCTWQLVTSTAKGLCVVHGNQGKQSQCQRTRTILGHPKLAPYRGVRGRECVAAGEPCGYTLETGA
jgi:hypothetical protein